jgi:hypothetical protein
MANGDFVDPYAPRPRSMADGLGQRMQGMFGGLSRGFQGGANALNPYSNRLLAFSAGMLGGGPSDAMKGLIAGSALDRESADRRKLNEAIAALQNDPDSSLLAGLSEAEQNYIAQDPAAIRTLIAGKIGGAGRGQEAFGLSGVWGEDPEGNPVFLQPSNRGGPLQQAEVPEGVTLNPSGNQRIDTGTEIIIQDRYGNVLSRTPKDVAGAAAAEEEGSAAGKAAASIPKVRQAADTMKKMIADIRTDPNIDIGVGGTSIFNRVPGSPGLAFQKKSDQLRGQTFLQAYESLRGANAITESEGRAATDAMTRIDTALSKEAYLEALADLEAIVDNAVKNATERAQTESAAPAAEDPLGLR